eukprot:g38153.t1
MDLEESGSSDEESTADSDSSDEVPSHSKSPVECESVKNGNVDIEKDLYPSPCADSSVPEPTSIQQETLNQTEPEVSSKMEPTASSSQDSNKLVTEEGARESSEEVEKVPTDTQDDENAPKAV